MEPNEQRIRIDKILWAVRLFKSRSLATEACEKSRVFIGDSAVKPSRLVGAGDVFSIRRTGLTRTYRILRIIETRVGAKLVPECITELTPQAEIDAFKARTSRVTIYRDPGTGRPTKRERRALDDFLDPESD